MPTERDDLIRGIEILQSRLDTFVSFVIVAVSWGAGHFARVEWTGGVLSGWVIEIGTIGWLATYLWRRYCRSESFLRVSMDNTPPPSVPIWVGVLGAFLVASVVDNPKPALLFLGMVVGELRADPGLLWFPVILATSFVIWVIIRRIRCWLSERGPEKVMRWASRNLQWPPFR